MIIFIAPTASMSTAKTAIITWKATIHAVLIPMNGRRNTAMVDLAAKNAMRLFAPSPATKQKKNQYRITI